MKKTILSLFLGALIFNLTSCKKSKNSDNFNSKLTCTYKNAHDIPGKFEYSYNYTNMTRSKFLVDSFWSEINNRGIWFLTGEDKYASIWGEGLYAVECIDIYGNKTSYY